MRIISGSHRGRVIHPPTNLRARPTTDFAKENIFNVLANYVDFEEIDVLDLFSGTGSIGYEFASRGAKSITSVEVNAVHHNYIARTAREFGFNAIRAVRANAFLYLKSTPQHFDVVFSDAPYDLSGSEQVVELVFGRGLLNPGGILVFEHSKGVDLSAHPRFLFMKSYGSVYFSVFQNDEDNTPDIDHEKI
ncbi:MAG: RsmD family RNA methyltransferase [Rikenellaceae bacterium]|jgi:16S rRNA (guanine(966)-N(2))-methyltransferase RsmD|nr:RsmD family RNA methyltransferase [Rikenellaceae bacterium]